MEGPSKGAKRASSEVAPLRKESCKEGPGGDDARRREGEGKVRVGDPVLVECLLMRKRDAGEKRGEDGMGWDRERHDGIITKAANPPGHAAALELEEELPSRDACHCPRAVAGVEGSWPGHGAIRELAGIDPALISRPGTCDVTGTPLCLAIGAGS